MPAQLRGADLAAVHRIDAVGDLDGLRAALPQGGRVVAVLGISQPQQFLSIRRRLVPTRPTRPCKEQQHDRH